MSEFRLEPERRLSETVRKARKRHLAERQAVLEGQRLSALRPVRLGTDPLFGPAVYAFGGLPEGEAAPHIARVLGAGQDPFGDRRRPYALKELSTWLSVTAIGEGRAQGFSGAAVVAQADLEPMDLLDIRSAVPGTLQHVAVREFYCWVPGAGLDLITEQALRMALASRWRRGRTRAAMRAIDLTEL